MQREEITSKLATYAADRIHKLAQKDSTLKPLDELIATRLNSIIKPAVVITDKEAERHIINNL